MLTCLQRDILVLARTKIDDGTQEFLCVAISRAAEDIGGHAHDAVQELRQYILKAMRGDGPDWYQTLNSWQRMNGWGHRSDEQCRLDRLTWIDWILDEPKC
jgi:hypothetical protein